MTEQKRTKAYGTDISILLLIHICRHFYFRKFSGMIHTHPLTNPLTNPTQPNPTQPNPTYPSPMAQQHSYIPGRSSPVCRHRPGDASGVVPQTDPSPLAQTTRAYLAADRGAPRPPPRPPHFPPVVLPLSPLPLPSPVLSPSPAWPPQQASFRTKWLVRSARWCRASEGRSPCPWRSSSLASGAGFE